MKTPDFPAMIFSISKQTGLKDYQIAAKLGVPASSLAGWKNSDHEPRYTAGARLIEYYKKVCK